MSSWKRIILSMVGADVQKSKTFRTSWANALKERPDDESRKRPAKTPQMVHQKTPRRLADKESFRAREDTEKYDS